MDGATARFGKLAAHGRLVGTAANVGVHRLRGEEPTAREIYYVISLRMHAVIIYHNYGKTTLLAPPACVNTTTTATLKVMALYAR